MELKKEDKKSRHPTEKKVSKPTPTPPIISCGKRDQDLLKHLSELRGKALNIKEYAREKNIPRSSVYEILGRLDRKGLAVKETYNNHITDKGLKFIESINKTENMSVGSSRQECLKPNKLSTHWHKFKFEIEDNSKFRIEKLMREFKINERDIKENRLSNLKQTIITLDEVKIIINPKKVILSLFDIISDELVDSDINSLHRALEYTQRLNKTGLVTSGVMLEEGHWARIESNLADWLYQNVDKRYYLLLDDGSKFWIDCSGGHNPEDETNNKLVRERIDTSLNLLGMGKVDLKDINSLKEISANLLKLESIRITSGLEPKPISEIKICNQDYIR